MYYLKEPYLNYQYDLNTSQWKEYYRDGTKWFNELIQINEMQICAVSEHGEKIYITI